MLDVTASRNFTGSSIINGTQVASMYGNVNQKGDITINKSIMNRSVYNENKETVQKDMDDFENMIYEAIESMNQFALTNSTSENVEAE